MFYFSETFIGKPSVCVRQPCFEGAMIKLRCPRFGFCVLYFLSILSNFLSQGILTQKWHEPKAEQFTKLKFLSYEIDENTKCQEPNGYFCASLRVIYNCSAFGSSYFCVSFSGERKSEGIERKFKTQFRKLVVQLLSPPKLPSRY